MEFNITSTDITYVIFAIVAVIVAFLIIKKVAGCLIKAVVFAILVAILGYIYYNFSMVEESEDGTEIEMTE
ncbi:MAG: hypothetical protein IJK08_00270 [Prevotella sp.]|jgi:O-antigen ligase|nr:hypothetical protein [Prevotella sp.]